MFYHLFQLGIFIFGLALLIKGADGLVDGASSLAKGLGLTSIFIGLTVVALGTSTPELAVSLMAAFGGNTDIALGNILGSNIANTLLILGICSVILPLTVKSSTVWNEIPFGLLAVILLGLMGIDGLFSGSTAVVSRIDGTILIFFLILFLYYTLSISRDDSVPTQNVEVYSRQKSWLLILAGLGGLFLGGKLVVGSAVHFASVLGLSEAVIGLTIVAVGTSLPELVTSVAAINKGNNDIAIGNIVGSNILNVFFILGLTAIINPLPIPKVLIIDILVAIMATLFLFGSMFYGKLYVLDRKEGVFFLLAYVCYVVFLLLR